MVVLFTKMRSTYIKQQNGCFVKFYANTKYNYSHTHTTKTTKKNGAYILISRGHIHLLNYECFCFIIFASEISKTNFLNQVSDIIFSHFIHQYVSLHCYKKCRISPFYFCLSLLHSNLVIIISSHIILLIMLGNYYLFKVCEIVLTICTAIW